MEYFSCGRFLAPARPSTRIKHLLAERALKPGDRFTTEQEMAVRFGVGLLMAFDDLLQILFNRIRNSLSGAEWDKGTEQHRRLLDALRGGNLEVARQTH
jgi:DNA-binding FadR family transcriptional regulator